MTRITPLALPLALAASSCAGASPKAPAPAVVELPPPPPDQRSSEPVEVPASHRMTVADYLADGFAKSFHKRCMIARTGPIGFAESDAPDRDEKPGDPLDDPRELVVVEEHPRTLRVVNEDTDFRITYFVRRADLGRAFGASTVLALRPDRPADPSAGARVAAGVALAEKAAQGDLRKLSGEVDSIRIEGWAPSSALVDVYEPEEFKSNEGDGWVREGADIVSSPGGDRIVRLPVFAGGGARPFSNLVTALPGAPAGYQAIRLVSKHVEIRGLVTTAEFKRKDPSDVGLGDLHGIAGGSAGGMSDVPLAKLVRGTSIYSPDGKERIGVARRDVIIYDYGLAEKAPGHHAIAFYFDPHGFITVAAKSGDLKPAR